MEGNYWNRKCKTEGCNGLARYDSDYCSECIGKFNLNLKNKQ